MRYSSGARENSANGGKKKKLKKKRGDQCPGGQAGKGERKAGSGGKEKGSEPPRSNTCGVGARKKRI